MSKKTGERSSKTSVQLEGLKKIKTKLNSSSRKTEKETIDISGLDIQEVETLEHEVSKFRKSSIE